MNIKKMILVGVASCCLTAGCIKKPNADFTISNQSPKEFETVNFTNTSEDSKTYKWQFGDGYYSTENNSSHSYKSPGEFKVKLSAYSKKEKKTSEKELTINVGKCDLRLKVEGTWNLNKSYVYYYLSSTNSLQNSDSTIHSTPKVWFFDQNLVYIDSEVYDEWSLVSNSEIFFDSGIWTVPFIDPNKMIWKITNVGASSYNVYYLHFSR